MNANLTDRIYALDAHPTGTKPEAEGAYAEVLALVAAINIELRDPDPDKALVDSYGTINNGALDRLQKAVAKLHKKLAEIARTLGFQSCSISVGGPVPSVSVSVTFGPAHDE
jgi:hypothetical protein